MFTQSINLDDIYEGYIPTRDWKPFPDIDDRDGWNRVKQDPRLASSIKAITRLADQVLAGKIDELPASMYMDFMRNGNRLHYEDNYFRRRAHLSALTIAECLTNDGRYLDKITDLMWAILGEVYWCVPAHNFAGEHEMVKFKKTNPWLADDPLPVPGDEYLDLFNCETAAILAESCYLLRPLLLRSIPSLYHLVNRKVDERVLSKLESPRLFGWYEGKNNWTPWCSHNLLLAATYVLEDRDRLVSIVQKLMVPMQRFFDSLKETGSCIEGPTYWVVSAGRLVAFIDLIETRFQVKLGFEDNTKFRNFGEHLVQLHIAGNKFVNFADGGQKVGLDHGLLSKYAAKIGSQALTNVLWDDVDRSAHKLLARDFEDRTHNEHVRFMLMQFTRLLFWTPQVTEAKGEFYHKSRWLPDMQVLVARQFAEPGKGLTLSCIAGSNDPHINHHSHNDVGHFSIYLDGEPVIIDFGQGDYSKATFSTERYDMWHISSAGHDVPQVNGLLQKAGKDKEARNVVYEQDGNLSKLSFDAAPAYFDEPAGNCIQRSFIFDHVTPSVTVTDELHLTESLKSLEIPLYVSERTITVIDDHSCTLTVGDKKLLLQGNNLKLSTVTAVKLADANHRNTWGQQVEKLVFMGEDLAKGTFSLTITVAE